MRASTLLHPLFAATTFAFTLTGCAGGGGGGSATPCCEATGQASGPSSFAPGELMAQPIAFTDTSFCLSLTTPLTLPEFIPLGDAVLVDPISNRYTVTINEVGAGRADVMIRIYDTDGDVENTYAVVGLSEAPVMAELPIRIAPVLLAGAVANETTLEESMFCRFRNGELGETLGANMRRADVRGVISPDVHASYVEEGITGVIQTIRNFRHALNGFAGASTDPNGQRPIREAAERAADAVRDQAAQNGDDPLIAARLSSIERYRTLLALAPEFSDNALAVKHAQAFAQDWNEEIDLGGFTLDTSTRAVRAQFIENHLLRYAIAEYQILDAVAAASVDLPLALDVGNPTIQASLDDLRGTLITTNSAAEITNAWRTFGTNVSQSVGLQKPVISSQLPTNKSNIDGTAPATMNAINRTQSHDEIGGLLYRTATVNGCWQNLKDQIDADYGGGTGPLMDDADRVRLTDLLFYPAINTPPY